MTRLTLFVLAVAATLSLAACAEAPMGPTVAVMPGDNTSFSDFQRDQATCRNFASQAVQDQARGRTCAAWERRR